MGRNVLSTRFHECYQREHSTAYPYPTPAPIPEAIPTGLVSTNVPDLGLSLKTLPSKTSDSGYASSSSSTSSSSSKSVRSERKTIAPVVTKYLQNTSRPRLSIVTDTTMSGTPSLRSATEAPQPQQHRALRHRHTFNEATPRPQLLSSSPVSIQQSQPHPISVNNPTSVRPRCPNAPVLQPSSLPVACPWANNNSNNNNNNGHIERLTRQEGRRATAPGSRFSGAGSRENAVPAEPSFIGGRRASQQTGRRNTTTSSSRPSVRAMAGGKRGRTLNGPPPRWMERPFDLDADEAVLDGCGIGIVREMVLDEDGESSADEDGDGGIDGHRRSRRRLTSGGSSRRGTLRASSVRQEEAAEHMEEDANENAIESSSSSGDDSASAILSRRRAAAAAVVLSRRRSSGLELGLGLRRDESSTSARALANVPNASNGPTRSRRGSTASLRTADMDSMSPLPSPSRMGPVMPRELIFGRGNLNGVRDDGLPNVASSMMSRSSSTRSLRPHTPAVLTEEPEEDLCIEPTPMPPASQLRSLSATSAGSNLGLSHNASSEGTEVVSPLRRMTMAMNRGLRRSPPTIPTPVPDDEEEEADFLAGEGSGPNSPVEEVTPARESEDRSEISLSIQAPTPMIPNPSMVTPSGRRRTSGLASETRPEPPARSLTASVPLIPLRLDRPASAASNSSSAVSDTSSFWSNNNGAMSEFSPASQATSLDTSLFDYQFPCSPIDQSEVPDMPDDTPVPNSNDILAPLPPPSSPRPTTRRLPRTVASDPSNPNPNTSPRPSVAGLPSLPEGVVAGGGPNRRMTTAGLPEMPPPSWSVPRRASLASMGHPQPRHNNNNIMNSPRASARSLPAPVESPSSRDARLTMDVTAASPVTLQSSLMGRRASTGGVTYPSRRSRSRLSPTRVHNPSLPPSNTASITPSNGSLSPTSAFYSLNPTNTPGFADPFNFTSISGPYDGLTSSIRRGSAPSPLRLEVTMDDGEEGGEQQLAAASTW